MGSFYQTDFMKRQIYVTKSRLGIEFVKKITFQMVIDQEIKEDGLDQNY